jgi:hypothetical protein
MNMKSISAAGLIMAIALPAFAQNDGTLPSGPKPAIKTDSTPTPAMPVPGKTSFTADQARERMINRDYTLTSNPLKGDNGIWYAEGKKNDGPAVMVMMDYQGNIYEGTSYGGHPSSAPGVEPVNKPPVKPVPPKAN